MRHNIDLVPKQKNGEAVSAADAAIAAAGYEAIQWLTTIPPESIRITVQDGWMSLEGTVECGHQRETLREVLRHLPGVKGLSDKIVSKPECAAPQAA